MVEVALRVVTVGETLAEGLVLGEVLMVPELGTLGSSIDNAANGLHALLAKMLAAEPPPAIGQRQVAGEVSPFSIHIRLERPRDNPYWREALQLRFHALRWMRPDGVHVGYVPQLRVAAVAEEEADLQPRMEKELRFALQRRRLGDSLFHLALLQRGESPVVAETEMHLEVQSPRDRAKEAAGNEAKEKSVLEEVATDLGRTKPPGAYERGELVGQIGDALGGRGARSVLLVGMSGTGKTAAVGQLVRERDLRGLVGREMWATSGSRLIAGALGFGMWQERCHKLCREAASRQAILYLGNLVELLEVGKSTSNEVSIGSFLRGYMARGDLLAIAECTPEQVAVLEREDPHLLAVFRQIRVDEPPRDAGRRILQRVAEERRGDGARTISGAALDVLERLHRRYATYSGFPGRPIRFLRNLLADATAATPEITPTEVTAAFARETGLPRFMLDDAVTLDVNEARGRLEREVIAQPAATEIVADLLATLKAGLNRRGRPIASLLFIGATGVGKTEMAKAIAGYFFSDRARLTRFDMSEYNTPGAAERLVGGFGQREGLLTAKVREQPFSVVLFDEVEKAHPAFFDLMLQVLGEARLTDASGRLADFSNTVVIMTSNLGAASFGRGGFGLVDAKGADPAGHFTEEVRAFLRPELYNRIDRIVPFLPLNGEAIGRIARRELELVRGRDGLRLREVEFAMDDAAAGYLAEKGFDPAYGARPLKRAIERELLVPLAEALNGYGEQLPLMADVREAAGGISVRVRARTQAAVTGLGPAIAQKAALLRRELQRLEKSAALLNVHNEMFRLERQIKREEAKRPNHPMLPAWHQRLKRIRGPAEEAAAITAAVVALEEAALLAFYERGPTPPRDWAGDLAALAARLHTALLELYSLRFENPDLVTVAVFGEQGPRLFQLARAYAQLARKQPGAMVLGRYAHDARGLLLHHEEKAWEYLAEASGKPLGIVMEFRGPHVLPLFEGERGSHLFRQEKREEPCLVEVSPEGLSSYNPPAEMHRVGGIEHGKWRRTIDMTARTINDPVLAREDRWTDLTENIGELVTANLVKVIREPVTP
jgi:ATP-dependent Clp protease ATP-binding subunit ClpA